MTDEEFDYDAQLMKPQEQLVRVLGFQCEKCGKRVVVYRYATQEPGDRTEIEQCARRFHSLDSCKVRARD